MIRQQQLDVLRAYDAKFENWEPEGADRYRNLPVGMGRGIKHTRWMVRRIEEDEESSPGQADRWIGFVQAILWVNGIYSIDDMAKANLAPTDPG